MRYFIIVGGIILLMVLLIPLIGAAILWSLNTLFGLGLPYTWKTILAAILLAAAIGGSSSAGARA